MLSHMFFILFGTLLAINTHPGSCMTSPPPIFLQGKYLLTRDQKDATPQALSQILKVILKLATDAVPGGEKESLEPLLHIKNRIDKQSTVAPH